ncbi:hypothetical protein QQ008_01715 [Fulvivirgaceae bacterium BMA10]|uniref:Uncharacterized protein n=1 Tax=Splendidivirga corallicola TaxID=3051826 RepID=A0ABT8KIG9_9BACT|nr:hypothetical protein [Fulvivirgaceae bacterium BMA10]
MRKKSLLFFVLLVLFQPVVLKIYAQVLENNPPSVRWQYIETDHFNILFQAGSEVLGQRMANTMEHLYRPVSKSLQKEVRKISIILQNNQAISNGFVTLAPRRSEFYINPPQDYNFLGTNEWINLLAVHEFRHVVQFEKSLTGFNKFLYYLFGQNTQGVWAGFAVPDWFWEGDAVGLETALTTSGRGRIPDFYRVYRTNLLERGPFSYNKQHLRSFKHFVPDHYRLGYFMTTHVRKHHGSESWSNITDRAWGLPFLPFTFSTAMKKETGKGLVDTYDDMMKEQRGKWEAQIDELEITEANPINKRKGDIYTNYLYPQVLANGKIVALKSGLGDIRQFISLDQEGNEKTEFIPGIMNPSSMLSLENNKIVWNEFEFDPRWRNRTYSVIKTYDFNTGENRTITKRSKYAGAALSKDGTKIASIHTSEKGENTLVVLDAHSGETLKSFQHEENALYLMPRWMDDGKTIIVLRTTREGKALIGLNTETGEEKEFFAPGNENIGHPVPHDSYIFYNSPYNGIDNIYVLDTRNDQRYQVTSRKYGAYNPVISSDGRYIIFNDFVKDGMNVVSMPLDTTLWKPLEEVKDINTHDYQIVVEQEGNAEILNNIPTHQYQIKDYPVAKGLFNIHSWGLNASTSLRELTAGIAARDVLSNFSTFIGYTYDANEKSGFARARFSYQRWFPIIDLEVNFGNRSTSENLRDMQGQVQRVKFQWQEKEINVGLRVPLILTKSKYFTNLSLSSSIGITEVTDFNQTVRLFDQQSNGILRSLTHNITFSRTLKTSKRDLNGKFGQELFLNYNHTPIGGDFTGQYLATQGELFLPGLFKHHSVNLRGGYQYQEINFVRNDQGVTLSDRNYGFPSYFFFPRGYSSTIFEHFYHFNANYALPLIYPDLSLGPVLNIQRIKANLFYDFGKGEILDASQNFSSVGIELKTDFNLMRFNQLLEIGVRFSYLTETNASSYELLIGNIGF